MEKGKKKNTGPARRIISIVIWLLFLAVLCEGAARLYLNVKDKVPFNAPASRHLLRYYPELEYVDKQKARAGEDGLEVLMLGASVLHNPLYDVAVPVYAFLSRNPAFQGRDIHIYNIGVSSQTTRDSLIKYRYLAGRHRFDVVVVYHGINEVRANNCPEDVFRDDYSHYAWYDEINFYHRNRALFRAGVYAPYFFHVAGRRLRARFSPRVYVPVSAPRKEWVRYGGDIKTEEPFRNNLEAMAELAFENKQTLLLSTFAFYLPEDYSLEQWEQGRGTRPDFAAPVELWGNPENVVKGIRTHNAQTRAAAAADKSTQLLDMAKLLPAKPELYIDICHLSPQGLTVFSKVMADGIARAAGKQEAKK